MLLVLAALGPGLAPAQTSAPADDPELSLLAEPPLRPEAVDQAVALLGGRYQTELPQFKLRPESGGALINPGGALLPDIIVKIGMVLGAVILAVFLFNMFYTSGKFDKGGHGDEPGELGEDDFARLQVPDPEQLAASGRFAEAIHALLLRALVLAARRLDLSWPRSLTSREILRRGKLPDGASSQLGQLIQRVEVHHFGGQEPVAEDFTRCREIYQRLSSELNGGRA